MYSDHNIKEKFKGTDIRQLLFEQGYILKFKIYLTLSKILHFLFLRNVM